jgi:hypothetical protein
METRVHWGYQYYNNEEMLMERFREKQAVFAISRRISAGQHFYLLPASKTMIYCG